MNSETKGSLDQWLAPLPLSVLALQWLVIIMPGLLVLGKVVANAQGLDSYGTIGFLQRLLLVCGLTQAFQISKGHCLPGLVGPSAVLMVGVLSTLEAGVSAVYTALACGGFLTALLGITGLAAKISRFFTRPVLASTLMLIAITLSPTMRDQLFDPNTKGGPLVSFGFGFFLCSLMLLGQQRLKGLLSSASLLMGVILGALVFHLADLSTLTNSSVLKGDWFLIPELGGLSFNFQPSCVLAFCLCYLALISNELAACEALGKICQAPNMPKRLNRALFSGGLGGLLAGFLGVVGPVTYSVSPAVVIATKNQSQWPLLPVAVICCLLAFFPAGLSVFTLTPPPVVGAVLLYLMSGTVHASLGILSQDEKPIRFCEGVVVGCAMTVGLIIAFLPESAAKGIPELLKPILGNGFVMGLLAALFLEHIIFRGSKQKSFQRQTGE